MFAWAQPGAADDVQSTFPPVRHPRPTPLPQPHHAAYPVTPTSRAGLNTPAFTARNGAGNTTPIASLARGSVQSGFNEVALRAVRRTSAPRPHRSLQIPAR